MEARSPALNEEVFSKAAAGATGERTMTIGSTVIATSVLLLILIVAGAIGWELIEPSFGSPSVPVWYWIALGVALVIAIVTIFRPRFAPITGPLYAVAEGLVLGGISRIFEYEFDGIVLQAIGLTLGVFVIMLVLYATRVIEVTKNFRLGVIAATGAIFLVYMVDLVLRFFGAEVPLINDSSPAGIAISVVIVAVAALNLVLDFDFIEQGADQRAPSYMSWYAAFGLLVTLVWLYLEILRLLAKMRSN
ncbi:MAG: Bax inhibitor-1/YccA family protein [Solirubrobacterales bacterium]